MDLFHYLGRENTGKYACDKNTILETFISNSKFSIFRIAITKINNVYYNLDSKLEKPESIGVEEQLISYLENVIKSKDKEIILIVSKEVELDGSWRK